METKICNKCKEEKETCEFHKSSSNKTGMRNECKVCRKKIKKKYYEENKLKILKDKKKYYLNNKDIILEKRITYQNKNIDNIQDYKKVYYQNNKDKFNEYYKIKYQNNEIYKIGKLVRSRLIHFLNSYNLHKDNKTFDIVGCTPEFLKEYIGKQFTEGMSWELMGKFIHVDHIIPLSSAKTEKEVYQLCHYTNLQPLWAEDNLRKGNKII